MSLEGTLAVHLGVSEGKVTEVAVRSTRPARPTSVLGGRTQGEVLRLVPLLFPVCGIAHAVACARAVEAAQAREADAAEEHARDVACLAEAAASHVWQLALAWPESAGGKASTERVREARRLADALRLAVLDPASTRAREVPDLETARAAADGLAAAIHAAEATELERLVREVSPAFGAASTRAVASLDLESTAERLAGDDAFAEEPEDDGPIDVSAYARQWGDDEVAALEGAHGRGLAARLAARRRDARAAAERLARALDETGASPRSRRLGPSAGVAMADTARGPLVYRVEIDVDRVRDVRVVAPTDWTFHPAGVLRDALTGAAATPTLARDASWLVLALDPCVPWRLEVSHA